VSNKARHLAALKSWETRRHGGPHGKVIHALSILAKNYSDYQTGEIHSEERLPRPALVPVGKGSLQIYYMPDLWAKCKKRSQFDVYEVWDSQDRDKAFFEVFRVAYTPGIRYYHIVCISDSREGWTRDDAVELERGVLDNLRDAVIDSQDVSVAEVDKNEVTNPRLLRSSLSKQLEFE
jgi:hypothetical protein